MVAVAAGDGPHVRGFRASIRLGHGEAAGPLAAGKARQIGLLLLLGPVGDDSLRTNAGVGPDAGAKSDRTLRQLERRKDEFLRGQPGAAIGLGDAPAEEAFLAHDGDDVRRDLIAAFDARLGRSGDVADEVANTLQQGFEGGRFTDHGKGFPVRLIPEAPPRAVRGSSAA